MAVKEIPNDVKLQRW